MLKKITGIKGLEFFVGAGQVCGSLTVGRDNGWTKRPVSALVEEPRVSFANSSVRNGDFRL